jgi:hypothetical protein
MEQHQIDELAKALKQQLRQEMIIEAPNAYCKTV